MSSSQSREELFKQKKELMSLFNPIIICESVRLEKVRDKRMELTACELSELLQGCFDEYFSDLFVLDVRSEQAFKKGHIIGSVNIQSVYKLVEYASVEGDPSQIYVFCGDRSLCKPQSFTIEFNEFLHKNGADVRAYFLKEGLGEFFTNYPEHCTGNYSDDEGNIHLSCDKALSSHFASPLKTPKKSRVLSEVIKTTQKRTPMPCYSLFLFHSPRIQ